MWIREAWTTRCADPTRVVKWTLELGRRRNNYPVLCIEIIEFQGWYKTTVWLGHKVIHKGGGERGIAARWHRRMETKWYERMEKEWSERPDDGYWDSTP